MAPASSAIASASVTSPATVVTVGDSAASLAKPSALRSTAVTSMPRSASRWAMSMPMPLPAPVTSAVAICSVVPRSANPSPDVIWFTR
jgi:hypothetical protein